MGGSIAHSGRSTSAHARGDVRGSRTVVWWLGLGLLSALAPACDGEAPRPGNLSGTSAAADPTDAGDSAPAEDDGDPAEGGSGEDTGEDAMPTYDADQVRFYLSRIAPHLVGRSLDYDENALIDTYGDEALAAILDGWTEEPGFGEAIRFMVANQLSASGNKDGVDFELPGNLANEIATEELPWSTLLTADYCVDHAGRHIECDTGSPYDAGVLATRAYLIPNKGRFNLSRAKRMLETFACRVYPMEPEIQIPLAKEVLIPLFQASNPEEQTVEGAEGGFGNGAACYGCHSQFGAHAQLFVRFDENGLWQAAATGLQDTESGAELGRSTAGLYTSHMNDPVAAASETSQMFGQPVENLRHAAEVISESPLFQSCTVKNLIGRVFNLPSGVSPAIEQELVDEIAMRVTADASDPSIRAYVMETFTEPRVIDAVIAEMETE